MIWAISSLIDGVWLTEPSLVVVVWKFHNSRGIKCHCYNLLLQERQFSLTLHPSYTLVYDKCYPRDYFLFCKDMTISFSEQEIILHFKNLLPPCSQNTGKINTSKTKVFFLCFPTWQFLLYSVWWEKIFHVQLSKSVKSFLPVSHHGITV